MLPQGPSRASACAARSPRAPAAAASTAAGTRGARRRLPLPLICKAVLLAAGVLLALHALSCGLFFCVRLPWALDLSGDASHELHGLYGLSGARACCRAQPLSLACHLPAVLRSLGRSRPAPARPEASLVRLPRGRLAVAGGPKRIDRGVLSPDDAPKLIPRVIHQTYKSSSIPEDALPLMQSWRALNPDWDIRFYDDAACLAFVRSEFPEYLAAYKSLPKNVERSDFFRCAPVMHPSRSPGDAVPCLCKLSALAALGSRKPPSLALTRQGERSKQCSANWAAAGSAVQEACQHARQSACCRSVARPGGSVCTAVGAGTWSYCAWAACTRTMDTECKKPLNDLVQPRDTLIVGWENEFLHMEHARFRSYARERQVGPPPPPQRLCCAASRQHGGAQLC